MSVIDWDEFRPFPSVLHVARGADARRYVPARTCRMEYDKVHTDYVCTACGETFEFDSYVPALYEDPGVEVCDFSGYKKFKYCPHCGARVEE